jgi:hypothetical protein
MREMLDDTSDPPAWVTHLALRGTYLPGTLRCTTRDPFRPPAYLLDDFGDTSTERSFKCYVDVRVNAYILGSGPATLTALLLKYHYSEHEGEDITDFVEDTKQLLEEYVSNLFLGREHVLFLGPTADLSSEAWRVIRYWDVQQGKDGTIIAVHSDRDHWRSFRPHDYGAYRSALEMELPAFTQAVTTANEARVSEYGGRIGADPSLPMLLTDAHQLREYYTNTGAYDHPDGPPAQPPPVPGDGDPLPEVGVDDSTPGPTPTPPGG